MGVSHRRRNARVTHEFFYGGKVYASEDEASGKRVAEIVETAVWDFGPLDCAFESGLGIFDR